MAKMESRDTVGCLMCAFSLLVLSAYVVLWANSNKDLRIAGTALAIFVAGIVVARHRAGIVCGAFFFVALRWVIGAIATGEPKAIAAAITFIAIPTLLLLIDGKRQSNDPTSHQY